MKVTATWRISTSVTVSSKKYRLAVVAGARFHHYPSNIGRPNWYLFGKKEVLNRLYFVSKHPELSRPLCCLALSIRAAMSLLHGVVHRDCGYFKRIAGNFAGWISLARKGLHPVSGRAVGATGLQGNKPARIP